LHVGLIIAAARRAAIGEAAYRAERPGEEADPEGGSARIRLLAAGRYNSASGASALGPVGD